MIFYQVNCADGTKQLSPTQAEAKAIDRNFKQVDIPTDKLGLMNYLNVLMSVIRPSAEPTPAPSEGVEPHPHQEAPESERPTFSNKPKAERELRRAEKIAESQDIDALTAWMFEAPAFQVERIFDALACRMRELLK